MFWQDLMKVKASYDEDDFIFGFYVIDKANSNVEIDGDPFLKRMLFEAASTINANWMKEGQKTETSQNSECGTWNIGNE